MIEPLPHDFYTYNGGIRCDMNHGPCACGAWHHGEPLQGVLQQDRQPVPNLVLWVVKRSAGKRYFYTRDLAELSLPKDIWGESKPGQRGERVYFKEGEYAVLKSIEVEMPQHVQTRS